MTRLTDYWPKIARQCGPFHRSAKRSCTLDISVSLECSVDRQQSFGDDKSDSDEIMMSESYSPIEKPPCILDLPDEVLMKIFNNLNLIELSRLAITSRDMCSKIITYYMLCPGGPARLIPREIRGSCISGRRFMWPANLRQRSRHIRFFCQLGTFFKRITFLFSTSKRLLLMVNFLEQFFKLPSPKRMELSDNNQRFILECMGLFINRMCRGWEEHECTKVLDFLGDIFGITPMIDTIFSAPLGQYTSLEFFVRSYYRLLCLDHLSPRNPANFIFWITSILRKHANREDNADQDRAKILAILYAPLVNEGDDDSGYSVSGDEEDGENREEIDDDDDEDEEEAEVRRNHDPVLADSKDDERNAAGDGEPLNDDIIGNYAREPVAKIAWTTLTTDFVIEELRELVNHVFRLTHDGKEPWNDDQIITLIQNLTNLPDRWSIENVASFLHLSGERVVKMYLRRSFSENYPSNVSGLIAYLAVVAYKDKKSPTWLLDMIEEFCSSNATYASCSQILDGISKALIEAMREIRFLMDAEEYYDPKELEDIGAATASFMHCAFQRFFLYPNFSHSIVHNSVILEICEADSSTHQSESDSESP